MPRHWHWHQGLTIAVPCHHLFERANNLLYSLYFRNRHCQNWRIRLDLSYLQVLYVSSSVSSSEVRPSQLTYSHLLLGQASNLQIFTRIVFFAMNNLTNLTSKYRTQPASICAFRSRSWLRQLHPRATTKAAIRSTAMNVRYDKQPNRLSLAHGCPN